MARNRVEILPEQGCVRKRFCSAIAQDNELKMYQILAGTGLIPRLILVKEHTMTLEYVIGATLRDITPSEAVFCAWARWFVAMEGVFYRQMGAYGCLEDANFGNFMVSKSGMVGIDFERWHIGTMEQALAMPLMHVQTMDCTCEVKMQIVRQMKGIFLQSGAKVQELERATEAELSALLLRRQMKPRIKQTSIGIMMGGEGRRMGGVAKHTLQYGDYTFLEHLEYQLADFDEVFYSVRRGMGVAPRCGTVVEDVDFGEGVAAGVAAVLQACQTEYLLVWACDMPYLTREFVFELLSRYDGCGDGLVPVVDGRRYPLSAVYSVRCAERVANMMRQGVRKLGTVLDGLDIAYWRLNDEPCELRNVNTVDEVRN